MAATCRVNEMNGTAPGAWTYGISNLNFGNYDGANLSYTTYPVRRGNNSYEKWIKLQWYTGAANKLSEFRFWRSDASGGTGAALPTGVSIVCEVGLSSDLTYTTPATTSIGTYDCPNTEATAMWVGPSQLTSVGSTYYVHIQAKTTALASTGDQATMYFSWSYIEE